MLIMFRAKNYRCFHDDVILDMRATGLREHSSHYQDIGSARILKSLALYGANASGKSTIVKAMQHFENFVLQNMFSQNASEEENMPSGLSTWAPFAFSAKQNYNSEMEMIFHSNGNYYQYGFEINLSTEEIQSEWLLFNEEEVFDLADGVIRSRSRFREDIKRLPRKRKDRLYLSVLDYFAEDELGYIVKEIENYFTNNLFFNWTPYLDILWGSLSNAGEAQSRFITDERFRKQVIDCVRSIDVGIVDIKLGSRIEKNSRTGQERKRYILKTIHNVFDDNGNIVDTQEMNIRNESTGTIKFLAMIQTILDVVENGGTFVIDELSESLHPLLTRFILDLFQSKENKSGAQLIFTTHDTSLLSNNQFRRDEVGFIEKNSRGESRLFTLADLRVRSDASFAKDYFNGRYGAIPVFQSEGGAF